MKFVKAVCADLDVPVQPSDIFRAHRVGLKKPEDGGRRHQAIIVRFRSWKARWVVQGSTDQGKTSKEESSITFGISLHQLGSHQRSLHPAGQGKGTD